MTVLTPKPRKNLPWEHFLAWFGITLVIVLSIFPIWIVLKTALSSSTTLFEGAPRLLPSEPTLDNFKRVLGMVSAEDALKAGGSGQSVNFLRSIWNSVVFTGLIVIGQTFFSALAAYAFARLKFPFRDQIFTLLLTAMMVPGIVLFIPNFITIKNLGWLNTMQGMVAPYILMTPFAVFFLRQFFLSIPKETEEAAVLDGASPFMIFWKVVLPMSQGPLATLGILTTIGMWNDFFWPYLIGKDESVYTLPVALQQFQTQTPQGSPDWTGLMAGAFLSIIPVFILLLIMGKRVIESLAFSGGK
ncbi:carbohydrate ABC transporter permease [Deinococcus roseus]|uniref:Sugar ABC transporter permease n=1 Tax=Deinococcus roseus TaxID=392414 RepID=A0ABQ2CY75_9DEIO|nr:carbohydrate ABC transporter permease [Deinococcus roseus]GGJ32279.1 sugar ABC transporter permease [Deinococcus roseus]